VELCLLTLLWEWRYNLINIKSINNKPSKADIEANQFNCNNNNTINSLRMTAADREINHSIEKNTNIPKTHAHSLNLRHFKKNVSTWRERENKQSNNEWFLLVFYMNRWWNFLFFFFIKCNFRLANTMFLR